MDETGEPTGGRRTESVVGSAVGRLHAAIDEVLGLAGDALLPAALHELVIGIERQRARLAIAGADAMVRWEDSRVWESDGSASASARLGLELHRSTRSTGRELGRARSLRHLPAVRSAVLAGRLSLDDVEVLARARRDAPEVFGAHEAGLVDICTRLDHRDAGAAVEYWRQRTHPEVCERAADRRRARTHLHASTTLDGMVDVSGALDPVNGAIVTNELDRLAAELKSSDRQAGVTRTASQRRAAALIEMAARSAAATMGSRARPLVTILVGDDTARHLCELSTGTVITPGDVIHHTGHALVESVIFDGPRHLIATTARRTFTGALRRAIQVRDRRCTHPGCHRPAESCDVDHTIAYTDRPITDQHGGRIRCPAHNRTHLAHHHRPTAIVTRPDPTALDHLRALIRWRTRIGWNGPDDDGDDAADDVGSCAFDQARSR